ncbi:MAG TPA: DNA internalization-related competence protein ComEC/Rec2 [Burkholderiales bacterium]|nr:DNA internalization-related competence protein ComEC/Rec2 [Burkholderiales bacterium]HYA47693.1 DNA internalization-related competence protein ComEC/Rec2 [Burkholderiales bacterium]
MRLAALGFALGVYALQQLPELPAWGVLASLCALAGAGAASGPRLPAIAAAPARFAAFAAIGLVWSAALAHCRLADRLDPDLEGRDVMVSGVIASLPQPVERGVRFDFDVETPESGVPRHVSLAWYGGFTSEGGGIALPVRPGERWRYRVRLRRPHGNLNPHGFDYEAWLLERGIRATGYVRSPGRGEDAAAERLEAMVTRPAYLIERVRESARERILGTLRDRPYAGVLIALAIGDQRAIDPGQWQLFARTGVSHLMSISGLHVTMIAGLFAALVSFCWRRCERLALALPAQKAAAFAGFLAAFAYCLVSGFAVPAQRTLYMVGVVAAALWLGCATSASRVLAAALLVVLVLDPWAVLSPGFWLSFAAVAVIFHVSSGHTAKPHWLAQWGRVQWAVTVGLAPLMLVLFQQVSLVSPLANAAAIPLVSFVVTPLALVGAGLPFGWPLELAHWILEALMALLGWLATLPGALWQQHAPVPWTVPLALLGIAWLLLPLGFPARWLGAVLALPLFTVQPAAPAVGELWITVLDVGQGLAVVVRTSNHALLYDAGPAFNAFSDSGGRIVLPYLRGEGVARLDAIVLSHDDRDHSGGAATVLGGISVAALWSSFPSALALPSAGPPSEPCVAGRAWQWDGVAFEFLHPASSPAAGRGTHANNRSCVLRIAGPGGRVLLAGDIERGAEQELLRRSPALLAADALLVPHHGSATSSSAEFVKSVAPRYAIFAVGYRNRFGHPREEVLERYREAGSTVVRTDSGGAIEIRCVPGGPRIGLQRERARRYWHEG